MSKLKRKKLSKPAKYIPLKEHQKAHPKPAKRKRIEYKVKTVKGGKYPCACGCGTKVAKLFAKGHVSRFVKLLTTKNLDHCVKVLRELKARIK